MRSRTLPNMDCLVQRFPHLYGEQIRSQQHRAEQIAQSVLEEPELSGFDTVDGSHQTAACDT